MDVAFKSYMSFGNMSCIVLDAHCMLDFKKCCFTLPASLKSFHNLVFIFLVLVLTFNEFFAN